MSESMCYTVWHIDAFTHKHMETSIVLGPKNLVGAFLTKAYAPPGNQIEMNACCVVFRELSNHMSNVLVPGWGTGFISQKLSFCRLLSDQVLDIFKKKFQKNSKECGGHH